MVAALEQMNTVMKRIDAFLGNAPLSVEQRDVLLVAVQQFTLREGARLSLLEHAGAFAFAPWLHFPTLGALLGDEPVSNDLILASFLIEVGIDLLDSVMDDELCAAFDSIEPAIIQMNAYLLITVLPDLLLTPKQLARKHKALLTVSAGQQLNVQRRHSFCETLYFDCIRQKTGAWRALYFQISRTSAHEFWDEIITDFGVVSQLYNDLHDIFSDGWSADLGDAIYTYPIIYEYNQVPSVAREQFKVQLQQAMESIETQQIIRERLKKSGVLKASYLLTSLLTVDIKRRVSAVNKTREAARLIENILEWHS